MNLYVGNLNFEVSEADLKDLFEEVGDVSNVRLMLDPDSGRSRGFAFIEMGDTEDAVIAMKTLNGRDFHGRNIVVNEGVKSDKPRQDSRSGDRNRSGGGGFNRGGGTYNRPNSGGGDRRPYDNNRSYDRPPSQGNSYESKNTDRPYNPERRPRRTED
jgi:RNA recognition motif-containing protein